MKYCRKCDSTKDDSEFYKDRNKIDGLTYYCRECIKRDCLKYSHSDIGKAKRADYNKKWSVENAHKKNASSRARQTAKLKARPNWADLDKIEGLYKQAKELERSTGVKYEVDHIVPLRSKFVCGLHVEHNLRVISSIENRIKGNKDWPDCP